MKVDKRYSIYSIHDTLSLKVGSMNSVSLKVKLQLKGKQAGRKTNSLLHHAALDGHQGVVDFDKVVLAVFFQVHGVKVQLDDVVGVGSQLPLDEGVWGIGMVGETGGLDFADVIAPGVF